MTRLRVETHLITSYKLVALLLKLPAMLYSFGGRLFFTVGCGNASGLREQLSMFGRRPYSIRVLRACEYGLPTNSGWLRWLVFIVMISAPNRDLPGNTPAPSEPGRDRVLAQALEAYAAAMNTSDRDQRLQGFALAEQLFRQVLTGSEQKDGLRNAALYVNLGNAALQAEHLGAAILAYRRALLLNPTHAQALQNLRYARSLIPEWVRRDSTTGLADTLFFWRGLYAREQILAVAAICFLVAAVLLATSLVRRQAFFRHLAVVPFAAWFVLIVSVGVGRSDRLTDEAVVIGRELVVHAADSENAPRRISLPLPSGAEVRITRQRDRWTEIEVSGGRSGWVVTSGLERVI